jgi:hypothetical protein
MQARYASGCTGAAWRAGVGVSVSAVGYALAMPMLLPADDDLDPATLLRGERELHRAVTASE